MDTEKPMASAIGRRISTARLSLAETMARSNQMIIRPQRVPTRAASHTVSSPVFETFSKPVLGTFSKAVRMAKLDDRKAKAPVMKTITPSEVCTILTYLEQSGDLITSWSVLERY